MTRTLRRVMQSVVVVIVASSFAFLLLHLAPGDPVSRMGIANGVPRELLAQWRHQEGYDQPMATQYTRWIGRVARGDFGHSSSQKRPVLDVIADRLPNTLVLMSLALSASILFGAAIGAWQGSRAGSRAERALSFVLLVVNAVPEFWLAMALLTVFALRIPILPAGGMIDVAMHDSMSTSEQLWDRLRHLALPWASLTLVGCAVFARYQRESMRDAMREPFVQTARAKGLSDRGARWHAWRTAILPIITMTGLFFPALFTGAVFVERIFGWPGMGEALVRAVGERDYALVSACVIMGSATTTVGALLADTARSYADPRLRHA